MAQNGSANGDKGNEGPLTESEAEAIISSWAVIWNDKKKNGIELFIKLFTIHPESQTYFKDFKGLSIEEVRTHKKLRAHALSVMYAVKSFIDNLDDLETLVELVRKNAKNHAARGIGEREMKWLIPVLVGLLEDNMNGQVTELHKTAWSKLMGVVADISKEEQAKV